jgi:hypothetical protein
MQNEFLNPIRSQGDFDQTRKKQISNGVKLTNIVYKLLEFFPESDPLKNRAKDRALAIMEHLVLIDERSKECPGWTSFQSEKFKIQLSEDIDILLGYIWIGKSQGWLNSSNCLIVTNEYEKIKKGIKPAIELTQKLPGIDRISNIEKDFHPSKNTDKESEQIEPKEQLSPVLNNTESETTGFSISNKQDDNLHELTERQKMIFEFIEKNGKAQVMDLQTILPDITKRTIRRDLDELLQSGKIIRMGDYNQVFYKINIPIGQSEVEVYES